MVPAMVDAATHTPPVLAFRFTAHRSLVIHEFGLKGVECGETQERVKTLPI